MPRLDLVVDRKSVAVGAFPHLVVATALTMEPAPMLLEELWRVARHAIVRTVTRWDMEARISTGMLTSGVSSSVSLWRQTASGDAD